MGFIYHSPFVFTVTSFYHVNSSQIKTTLLGVQ